MRFVTCFALGAAVSLAACGDDDDDMTPEPECQGHLCGKGLLPDGGEIRFENFMGPDGNVYPSGYAFFFKDQVPDKVDFPTRGACNQVRAVQQFPWASGGPSMNPAAFEVQRTYLDAGASVSATNPAGKSTSLPKAMNGTDYNGRWHGTFYSAPFGSLDLETLGGNGLNSRTELQVTVAGGADIPATTYIGGIGSPNPGITIPNRPDLVPNLSDAERNSPPACDPNNPMVPPPPACCDSATQTCTGPAFVPVPRDADMTFTWEAPAETADNILPDVTTLFIGWGGFDGNPNMMCIVDAANGTFTVSKEDIATLPDNGIIFSGFQYHQFNEIGGRRIDMVGNSCRSAVFGKM